MVIQYVPTSGFLAWKPHYRRRNSACSLWAKCHCSLRLCEWWIALQQAHSFSDLMITLGSVVLMTINHEVLIFMSAITSNTSTPNMLCVRQYKGCAVVPHSSVKNLWILWVIIIDITQMLFHNMQLFVWQSKKAKPLYTKQSYFTDNFESSFLSYFTKSSI